jgi:phospholipid/cholesterol/gamma-HCH transport system substrate-binding protein
VTERNLTKSALIGLGATIGLMVVAWLIGGMRIFERTYTVSAVFSDAGDVQAGDPVRVAGVDVGTVKSIERQPRTVRMDLEIRKGTELSRGTGASVRLRTLLGKKFVELQDPGTGPLMAGGHVIPLSRTRAVTDVDEVVTSFDRAIEQTDVDALNEVIRSFDRVMAGRGERLGTLLGDAEKLIGTLADRKSDIDRLIAAGEKLTSAVASREQALGTSIEGMAAALDSLAARRSELSALVSGVQGLTQRLTPLVQRNEASLDKVLTDLLETSKVLDRQKARIDLALDQLPEAVYSLVKVTRQGSWINVYNVGFPMSPYLAHPTDTGDSHGQEPGETGGLPRIWLRPPATVPPTEAGGVHVDGSDNQPPPPEGFYE